MEFEAYPQYSHIDTELVDKVVYKLKAQGIFDQFRKDCLADVDTKPAFQNLQQRVNGTVASFLANHKWRHDLNKNQLRESLRRHVQQGFLEVGVDRIVDQVVNPKICPVFLPRVEDVVYDCLGIEKPKNTKPSDYQSPAMPSVTGRGGSPLGLLPKDLDPVSPESAGLADEDSAAAADPSDDSHLSGISELTSHGSFKDFSESAHMPEKTSPRPDLLRNGFHPSAHADPSLLRSDHSDSDFDNFTNLKEKLKKTDYLNVNLRKSTSREKLCDDPDLPEETSHSGFGNGFFPEEAGKERAVESSEVSREVKTEKLDDSSSTLNRFFSDDSRSSDVPGKEKRKSRHDPGKDGPESRKEDEEKPAEEESNYKAETDGEQTSSDKDVKSDDLPSDGRAEEGEGSDTRVQREDSVEEGVSVAEVENKEAASPGKSEEPSAKMESPGKSSGGDHRSSSGSRERKHSEHKSGKRDRDKSGPEKKEESKDRKNKERYRESRKKYGSSRDDKRRSGKEKAEDREKDSSGGPKSESSRSAKDHRSKEEQSKHVSEREKYKSEKDKSEKDKSEKDKSEKDKSEKDKSEKDKSEKDKSEKDKSEKDKSEKDKSAEKKDGSRDEKREKSREDKQRSGKDSKRSSGSLKEGEPGAEAKVGDGKRSNEERSKSRKVGNGESSGHDRSKRRSGERDSKKRKGERCKEEVKHKEARRSTDRDSNGGGSGSAAVDRGNRGQKEAKGTDTESTQSLGNSGNDKHSCSDSLESSKNCDDDPSDIDLILLKINSSIEEVQKEMNDESAHPVSDGGGFPTSDDDSPQPPLRKPKIAKNIFEIRKIMQARKNIDRKRRKDIVKKNSTRRADENVRTDVQSVSLPHEKTEFVTGASDVNENVDSNNFFEKRDSEERSGNSGGKSNTSTNDVGRKQTLLGQENCEARTAEDGGELESGDDFPGFSETEVNSSTQKVSLFRSCTSGGEKKVSALPTVPVSPKNWADSCPRSRIDKCSVRLTCVKDRNRLDENLNSRPESPEQNGSPSSPPRPKVRRSVPKKDGENRKKERKNLNTKGTNTDVEEADSNTVETNGNPKGTNITVKESDTYDSKLSGKNGCFVMVHMMSSSEILDATKRITCESQEIVGSCTVYDKSRVTIAETTVEEISAYELGESFSSDVGDSKPLSQSLTETMLDNLLKESSLVSDYSEYDCQNSSPDDFWSKVNSSLEEEAETVDGVQNPYIDSTNSPSSTDPDSETSKSKPRNSNRARQRYESSDLYKPRPSLTSRRKRTQSNESSSASENTKRRLTPLDPSERRRGR